MKTQKKRSSVKTRFRPGTTGACEAQLWTFAGPPEILKDDHAPDVHWVAAESLDAALLFLRRRHDDFTITEARFIGMIPLVCDSSSAATEFRPAQCLASVESRVISLWQ